MEQPLANGTLLQNRFRVVKILGQGGCGRTYLATDEQRFQEYCAIKEYFPLQGDAATVQKLRALFQREAEILYQIQHPQIPQFRALFAEAERFFFAQDFVEGKPYHQLWQERLSQGETFTEAEVLELFDRLLPILGYLHQQNIIHRDISLDNIMLRDRDQMPVLIDFGVGKMELAQSPASHAPYGTIVGKSGYSPLEQLKTGNVYPNSDLYALAVSAIVLLTGKAPGDLFDEMTLNWSWRMHAPNTRQQFAQILDRMLHYQPPQRYQSAAEVLEQLDLINPQLQLANAMAVKSTLPATTSGIKPPPRTSNIRPQHQTLVSNRQSDGKFWRWGIQTIVAVSAISSLSISISNIFKQPSDRSTAIATDLSSTAPQLLTPVNDRPIEIAGQLEANGVKRYAIEGTPASELSIRVISGGINVHILHPDGQTPPGSPIVSSTGNYFFPFAGKFFLDVKSPTATKFALSITLMPNSRSRSIQPPHNRPPEMNSFPPDRSIR